MTHLLLSALLALMPASRFTRCLRLRAPQIEADADAGAQTFGVPPAVLLAVGWMESHLGCDPASGGCWGAPIDTRHRLTAGTPNHAARALARSYAVCGSWRGAIGRFRSGLCRPWQAEHRAYVARAAALVARIHAEAGTPPPDGL